MISHKHKCIFIHISKCAGTSVENAFGVFKGTPESLTYHRGWDPVNKLYLQHATPQQLIDLKLITKEQWSTYYKFIIYRNSWSKLLSDYFWVSRVHKIDDSFENFLYKKGGFFKVLNESNLESYCGDHLYKQKDYFFLDGERITYDTEIDFDNINEGFEKVVADLSLENGFFNSKHNITNYNKKHYSNFYSPRNKKMVGDLYAEDISFFNFQFEDKTKFGLWLNSIISKLP